MKRKKKKPFHERVGTKGKTPEEIRARRQVQAIEHARNRYAKSPEGKRELHVLTKFQEADAFARKYQRPFKVPQLTPLKIIRRKAGDMTPKL